MCTTSFGKTDGTYVQDVFSSTTDRKYVGFGATVSLPAEVTPQQRIVLGFTLWKVFNLPQSNYRVIVTFKSPQHKHSAVSQVACVSRHVAEFETREIDEIIHNKPVLQCEIVEGCSEFTLENVSMATLRSLQVQRLIETTRASKKWHCNSQNDDNDTYPAVESQLFGFPLESITVVKSNTVDDKHDTAKRTNSTNDNSDDDNSASDDSDNRKHSKLFAILVDEECKKRPMDGLTDEVRQNRAKLSEQSNGSVWNIDVIMQSGEIAVSDAATAVRNAHTAFNELVKKFLSLLRTFDMPTPLQDKHFVRLRTVEHCGETLTALMSNSVMTMFSDTNDNDHDDSTFHCNDHLAQRADRLFKDRKDNLILLGEAGQGKTSLLRHWMQEFNTETQLVLYVRADVLWQQFSATNSIDATSLAAAVKKGFQGPLHEKDRKTIKKLMDEGEFLYLLVLRVVCSTLFLFFFAQLILRILYVSQSHC